MSSYKNLEQVLKDINTNYIQLKTDEVRRNNEILKFTLEKMIETMKKLDPLFKTIFQEPFYGGSFYDDLKVGKPDEFDLDLLMVFSKIVCQEHNKKNCSCVVVEPSNRPGFFWFMVDENFYQPLNNNNFIVDGYMQTDVILSWLQSLVTRALDQICSIHSTIYSADVDYKPPNYYSQSGPAITLRLFGQFGHMDVDLVPAFKFGANSWPKQGYRPNPFKDKNDFFIVPKKTSGMYHCERYWRASFQCQERQLINNKQRLKPALRLLKKMRNNLDHQISSYALKTIVLVNLDSGDFNRDATLAETFMKLLEKYSDCLKNKKIAYYWNKRNNLLDCTISDETLTNHYNEISRKIAKINREHMEDPFVVAKVILREGSDEYKTLTTDDKDDLYNTRNPYGYGGSNGGYGDSDGGYGGSDGGNGGSYGGSQATSSSWSTTGKVLLGVGAVAAVAFCALGSLMNSNRRNN